MPCSQDVLYRQATHPPLFPCCIRGVPARPCCRCGGTRTGTAVLRTRSPTGHHDAGSHGPLRSQGPQAPCADTSHKADARAVAPWRVSSSDQVRTSDHKRVSGAACTPVDLHQKHDRKDRDAGDDDRSDRQPVAFEKIDQHYCPLFDVKQKERRQRGFDAVRKDRGFIGNAEIKAHCRRAVARQNLARKMLITQHFCQARLRELSSNIDLNQGNCCEISSPSFSCDIDRLELVASARIVTLRS